MGSQRLLDDLTFITRLDPKGMLDLTVRLPQQIAEGFAIADKAAIRLRKPKALVVAALGGSAAGGDYVRALADLHGNVPVVVSRDYSLPVWCDAETLVVCASYSGNTEETLASFEDAVRRGCQVAALTSGGELAQRAAKHGFPATIIPSGQPPRTALGYMLAPLVRFAEAASIIPPQDADAAARAAQSAIEANGPTMPEPENVSKQIATAFHGRMGAVYGLGVWQAAVASRWRSQINENAKNLILQHTLPEMNHNEVLGWVAANGQTPHRYVALMLQDGTESIQMKTRARVMRELIAPSCDWLEATAPNGATLEKMLYLSALGDLASLYLAALNGIDPEDIAWINRLKSELAAVQTPS